jgi:hypothetical protein
MAAAASAGADPVAYGGGVAGLDVGPVWAGIGLICFFIVLI